MEEKIKLKQSIIESCRNIILETINHLTREMEEHQQLANDYGPPKDRYDSFRSQMLRRRDMYAQQLHKANQELTALEKIDASEIKNEVVFGAVVITSQQKLFVSISVGKLSVGDTLYYAVSPNVPVYNALKGLKKGDTAAFNNTVIEVLDVF
ncbi:MAG TPA: hypothetical protein PLI16_02235 [Bacteroidales bacterium]|jgi:septation ring formation regulator EzrA|nr:hypothetical protein [Bacteroidales bacterium]HNZ42810.1 hypothetical protein [Bacteroidales bacterium]HOH83407.1 hypothetical protein [Bacteroidales bacterium]HPB26289.1 hypothetical protein [Bacteroidales bacterium]HPI29380.1 hypothetical protein [Bacteroidales bacterium]